MLYLVTKYAVFFTVLAFMDNRFKEIVLDNADNSRELKQMTLGYIVEILFAVLMLTIFLIVPLYGVLRLKNKYHIIIAFTVYIIFECILYQYTCGNEEPQVGIDGLVNGIISMVFFPLFFWRFIVSKCMQDHLAKEPAETGV